jgi:hypothetical protein
MATEGTESGAAHPGDAVTGVLTGGAAPDGPLLDHHLEELAVMVEHTLMLGAGEAGASALDNA